MFFALAMAMAADVSGIWTGTMRDRNGDLQDFSFRFVHQGDSLTGKMYSDNESIAITGGKVEGDRIAFLVTTELNGSIFKTLFTGTLTGHQIQVVREKADPPAPGKPNTKQTFVMKRL